MAIFPRESELAIASCCPTRRRSGRRRGWIGVWAGLLLATLAGGSACDGGRAGPQRIVLVTIDTLRADRIGAYGDLGAHTPHLDALGKRGVRFEEAIAPTPLTLPSHASLMTGRHPPEHGVRHNSVFVVDEEIPVLAERMKEAGYTTAAFVGAFVLDSRFGLARGFDTYDDAVSERRAADNPFSFAERRADAVVDSALGWMEDAPDRFFLWVHLYDPHANYDPPAPYQRRASGDAYGGEIAFADAQVGRLLRHIGRRWPRQQPLVVVTSDHGESLGQHQEATHSYTVYDATQHVPLFLAGPGVPSDRVVGEQVRLVDVAPTLLQAAGAEPIGGIRGRSLLSLVRGREQSRRVAYVETLATQLDMGWSPLLGVRTSQFKYIRAPQPELYDLRKDPGETHNLALVRPEKTRELDEVLEEELEGSRPAELSREVDAEERARLESLGYVVPEPGAGGGDLGVVGGPNPRDHMRDAAQLKAARRALAEGDAERALELSQAVAGSGPQVVQTRALAAVAADRPERAIAMLEEAKAQGPASTRDLLLLGMAYAAADRVEDARGAYEEARRLSPESAEPRTGLGRLALRRGKFDVAERHFQEAEQRAAQPEAIRVHRAALRLHQGRIEEADTLLEGIGEPFLAEPERTLLLAQAERAAGRGERAVELLRRALEERPEHPRLLATQATLLGSQSRFDEALRLWRRLYETAPEKPGSKNDLAWGLAMAGRELDRALALAQEAARALDGDPTVLDTLATVHLARSEPERALEVAEHALAADGADPVRLHLLFVRASALAALGREDEARSALRALAAEPGELAAPWKEREERLRARLGTPKGAVGRDSRAAAAEVAGARKKATAAGSPPGAPAAP